MTSDAAATETALPTGEQLEIQHGPWRAVVTEVGAALRVLQHDGRDLVDGFPPEARVKGCRGQQLLPWPNRVRDGLYEFGGEQLQLDLSEPKRHNAIHGLVRWVSWTTLEHTASSLTQEVVVHPQQGWPGTVRASVTHTLGDDGLTVDVRARNIGPVAVPFGYAAHPYFGVGQERVDDIAVQVPASTYLEVDDRLLPVALHPVDGRPEDLRPGTELGDRVLDTAFTGLSREEDGRWRVRLSRGEREVVLWGEEGLDWIQVFTGEHRRDLGLAVEPMTCGPDAFNPGPTHDGVLVLAPGDDFSCRWGVTGR
ncbi:aldose epimerase [Desertihabitans brevis]|uniref:Aldose epimerase n=1 Tax=Desertihabitans brevis TaxID=2268447 RepID=A0A367Z2B4_9ACTN|nr:aldose 1-epimerase family protein [Desertihabitans brevis]RCK71392.1 aldose epimerase [Desertihabitans brevis]